MARILLAEGESAPRKVLSTALENAGHEVVAVINGLNGLRAFNKKPFDGVVTDVNMSEMDGLELIRHVRRVSSAVRIIVMADDAYGLSAELLQRAASAVGADITRRKPVMVPDIVESLADIKSE